jgi:hypothetical protein
MNTAKLITFVAAVVFVFNKYVTIKSSLDSISTLSKARSLHTPANSKAILAAIDNHATQILSAVLTKDTPTFKVESWSQHSHPHFIITP